MVCCPFHSDSDPSMKLNDNYYYCFGCGANGDAIDLTAKLFDLNPRQAAEKLMHDFGLDPDKPPANAIALPPPKRGLTDEQWADIAYCLRVLTDYLDLLHDWQERYKPATPEEPHDPRFEEASTRPRPSTPDGLRCIWNTPAEGRCRRTAAVRIVPADAGRAHRPPCSGKVRLTIHSPKVVLIIMINTTLLFIGEPPHEEKHFPQSLMAGLVQRQEN